MHPAKSVIFFTTASGAGYGLMIWLAVLAALGLVPAEPVLGSIGLGLGLVLIISGLLSSTFHLGRPERAWRALSQWRSSWLSREGVAAILTFVPLGLFALSWVVLGQNSGPAAAIGLVGAAMSLLTIFTTSMIYASLKTIPAWSNGYTVMGYVVLGPMNGALIALLLVFAFSLEAATQFMRDAALAFLAAAVVIKLMYWRHIQSTPATSTAGSATGLGHLGTVEMTASPHDIDNYLLREMGFRIARKHAEKLRLIALALAFLLPVAGLAWTFININPTVNFILLIGCWLSCQAGITVERWLFFAEAKHVVTLYYGEQAV
ncbi:dimethyl sulfoxide reductase anchor subunit family protein [Parerythrobacter aestuarii]|uniref:dimethyl sulfoxide reductase anchor subunit family protein n=1 Tax=Parerythrobacter aestuarii TaxID=3020909 RepID=UPI0024DE2D95|nr:DmsC/YnfH family molybdoenzyme membrane anchor subunit [Parerythrobacter aestuarii]